MNLLPAIIDRERGSGLAVARASSPAGSGGVSPPVSDHSVASRTCEGFAHRDGAETRRRGRPRYGSRYSAAFTMLEIAVSLGVIAIGMVAILGVLPSGLNVQKDNRERTYVNEDARLLIDALREGNEGLYALTNHVEAILRIGTNLAGNVSTGYMVLENPHFDPNFVSGELGNNSKPLLTNSPVVILAALGSPAGTPISTKNFYLSHTVALMRSFSGGMLEQVEGSSNDLSFHYYLTVEVSPFTGYYLTSDITTNASTSASAAYQSLFRQLQVNVEANNVHELRLTFAWPVLPNGRVGVNRQTYRTLISGVQQQAIFPILKNNEGLFYLFQSQKYQPQPNPPL